MKTLIVSLSPKKRFSASMYYAKILKFFMNEKDVSIIEVKTHKEYFKLESQLSKIDNLVLVTPVYVDTIPSTALEKLQSIQNYISDKDISLNIYTITNCGFYEGVQCKLAQDTIRIFSEKCNFSFNGGIGIGSGVMLSFIRVLIPLGILITLFEVLILFISTFITSGSITFSDVSYFPYTLIIQTLLYFLWSMGLFINSFKMAKSIKSGKNFGVRYTGLWFCPRFLFVIMGSIYWILASMFWYRGKFFRLHKKPIKPYQNKNNKSY